MPKSDAEALHHLVETNYFPLADKTTHYSHKDVAEFFEDLQKVQNVVWLIRVWNDKNPEKAHSLLYCCSDNLKKFWFYNSKKVGLFSFKNSKDLSHQFFSHLQIFFPSHYKAGGHLIVKEMGLKEKAQT